MALFLGFEANKSYKSAGVKLNHPWGGFRWHLGQILFYC